MSDVKRPFQDPNFLRSQQYKNASNLDARAALHRQFSTAATQWQPWVFDQITLQAGETVLECGCGPGWLWRENRQRIPAGCTITLTDLSEGMVAEARQALAGEGSAFRFQVASIMDLPFEDGTFDVVVANHMLYHVPDRAKALAEVRRVLKANGRFFAATNGRRHMQELTQMGQELFPDIETLLPGGRLASSMSMSLSFRLENGAEQLRPYFSHIEMIPYPDGLRVTEAAPLVVYVLSTVQHLTIPEAIRQKLHDYFAAKIAEDGAVTITKESGLFVARP